MSVRVDQKSVLEMAGGAIMERADLEMGKILDNILDPNTKAGEARVLTIKLEFKPDERRETVALKTTAQSKLAATASVQSMLCVGEDENGELSAYEATAQIPGQHNLSGGEQEQPLKLRILKGA